LDTEVLYQLKANGIIRCHEHPSEMWRNSLRWLL